MSETPLVKKLGIRSGQRVLVLNAPDGQVRLRPVTQISVDAIWSAMRLQPEEQAGK